ncbi:unnamed protein product [Closterium sp. NIES-64]|nr:unnamed protein product [Closterium sp. NIES-64]
MYITLYFTVTRLPDSLRVVRDYFLPVCPTTLTVDLLEKSLLAAEKSIVAVGASRGPKGARARVELAGAVEVEVAVAEGVGGGGGGGGGVEVLVRQWRRRRRWRRALLAEAEVAVEAEAAEVEVVEGGRIVALRSGSSTGGGQRQPQQQQRSSYSEAALSGTSESALSGTASASASHTFTLDSGASRSFFRDRTTLTPLSRPVAVSLADPSGGPVLSRFSTVLPCPAAPSGTLSGLYLPSFSTNLVSGADLQDAACCPSLLPVSSDRGPVADAAHGRVGPCPRPWTRHERYFLLVVDDYSRYTAVFPLRSKGDVTEVLIDGSAQLVLQLRQSFGSDFPVLHLHSDRGGEFSSDLLRAYCCARGIRQTFTLPDSPQQNGIAERRIGMVMDINLHPRVSRPETSPALLWTGKVGDASAFRFYHPTSRRVLSSQDVTFDESVPYYRLFPYRTPSLPPPPLSLVDVVEPVEVTGDSGAAAGAEPRPGGAGPGGAEPGGAELGVLILGVLSLGVLSLGVLSLGVLRLEVLRLEVPCLGVLSLEVLRLEVLWTTTGGPAGGASGAAGGSGAARGAAGAGAPAGGPGAVPTVSGVVTRPRPYFVPLLQQVLGLPPSTGPPPSLESPQPVLSQPQLQPASPLPAPSPYAGPTGGLAERREPASRPTSPSDSLRTASPTVTRFLATVVTDPFFESSAASALVIELVDFAARCRLDYAASLVAESESVCPPSVGGECALGTDVLEDRQEEFQCLAAASPHLLSVLLTPEGDPDALDIPTPRSYAEAIEGPYSSQWQAAMDAEMASLKSTGTYVDAVPLLGLHEEIWLRRPRGFTGSFPPGTQWSLRRPVYGLRQAPREWHDTLRTTLAALGFAPSTANPSPFLRTDTSLPPFYILLYVDDLVFATADTAGLAYVKSELQKRHTCTDLGELRSYLGLQITRDRARRTITLTQSHMVQQVLQRFRFTYSSPQATPLPTRHSLSALPSDESVESSGPYPELVGCIMYLMTCTRPELAYPLSILARYVAPRRHRPEHMAAAKRVLR